MGGCICGTCTLTAHGPPPLQVYFVITADRQRAKRERSRRASRAFSHRWTTFVGGVGSASAAGVEAAAAAAAAAVAEASRPGPRPDPAPAPPHHSFPPDGGNGAAQGLGTAGTAGGTVGGAAPVGGTSVRLRRRARSAAQNGVRKGAEPPRFSGAMDPPYSGQVHPLGLGV